MATLNDFRAKFPSLRELDDYDAARRIAEVTGADVQGLYADFGLAEPDAPGVKSSFDAFLGQTVQGTGRWIGDHTGWENNPIQRYGKSIVDTNPSSGVSVFEDPALATREIAGQVGGAVGLQLGLQGVGAGLRMIPTVPTQALGWGISAAAPYFASMPAAYESNRARQDANGEKDLLAADAATLAQGVIEGRFGINRFIRPGAVSKSAIREFAGTEMADSALKTGLRTVRRIALEEGGEELLQQPLEQWQAGESPFTRSNLAETGIAGVHGTVGGVMFGGLGGARAARRHNQVVDLLNREQDPTLNPEAWRQAGEAQAGVIDRTQGRAAGDAYIQDRDYQRYLAPLQEEAMQAEAIRARPLSAVPAENLITETAPIGDFINSSLGVNDISTKAHNKQQGAYNKLFNEGSGVFSTDPETQVEKELSIGELHQIRDIPQVADPKLQTSTYDANNPKTAPLPTTVGDAVGVLEAARVAQANNQALVVGSPEHSAVVAAQQLLTDNGLTYRPEAAQTVSQATPPISKKSSAKAELQTQLDSLFEAGAITPEQHAAGAELVRVGKLGVVRKQISAFARDHEIAQQAAAEPAPILPTTPEMKSQGVLAPVGPDAVGSLGDANVLAKIKAGMTVKQRPVLDHLVAAAQDNNLDSVIDANGVFQYQAIGDALGMARGSAKSFIDGAAKGIAKSLGMTVEGVKEVLKARAIGQRTTEVHNQDGLGLPPEMQSMQLDEQNLFGGESGAQQSMGIIASEGGSQSDIGGNEAPPNYVDSVTPSENTVAHARMERAQAVPQLPEEMTLLEVVQSRIPDAQPIDVIDAEAEYDAQLLEGDVPFAELPVQLQAQAVRAYINWQDGNITSQLLTRIHGDIADAHRQLRKQTPELQGAASGPRGDNDASGEGRSVEEGSTAQGVPGRISRASEAGDTAASPAVPETVSTTARSSDAQESASTSEDQGVTARAIEARWNESNSVPWDTLTDEQKNYLLGSGTWAEVDEAAAEVQSELTDEQSDYDAGEETVVIKGARNPDLAQNETPLSQTFDTSTQAVAWLSKNAKGVWLRGVMRAIAPFIRDVPIRVLNVGDVVDPAIMHEFNYRRARGLSVFVTTPSGTEDAIYLLNHAGTTEEVLAHELLHIATRRRLANKAVAAAFVDLAKQVRSALTTHNGAWPIDDPGIKEMYDFFRDPKIFGDVDEFVAYGFTSPTFQKIMARIAADGRWMAEYRTPDQLAKVNKNAGFSRQRLVPVPERSLWQKFVDAVRSAFGLPEIYKAAIEKAVAANAAITLNNERASSVEFASLQEKMDSLLGQLLQAPEVTDFNEVRANAETKANRDSIGVAPNSIPEFKKFTESAIGEIWQRSKDTALDLANKALDKVIFLHDLIERATKQGLTSAEAFQRAMNEKDQIKNRMEKEVDLIMERASDVKDKAAVEAFLKESTMSSLWGFAPSWKSGVVVDPGMAAQFNALSAQGREVAEAVLHHGEKTYVEIQRLMTQSVNAELDALIKRFPQKRAEYEKLRAKELSRVRRVMPKSSGPYAPLKRFGDYVVVARSTAYMDAEANNDEQLMDKLIQSDTGNHYVMEFHATMGDAKARAAQLAPFFPGGDVSHRTKQKQFSTMDELPWAGIAKVKAAIENDPEMEGKEKLHQMVSELYLQMLAEGSARKSELRRRGAGRGVVGAGDMFRAFASQGRSMSHFVANLEKSQEINRQLTAMRNEARAARSADLNSTMNEIAARYAQGLEYKERPLVDKALRATSLWMLLTSPAYYLTNATQAYMVALPVLGGRFKGRAFTEINRAYKDVLPILGQLGHDPDFSKMKLTAGEAAMLKELTETGRLDITMAAELGRWAEGAATQGKVAHALGKLNMAVTKVEAVNRITTALAAYRLSGSVSYAAKVVDQTQGNYAAGNAPRFFNSSGAAKLITQFRKYQLIQISLLGRLLHDSFSGSSKDEKAVARRALGWLFAQQAVFTGVKGLPIPALVYMVAAALGGDDDKDWERNLRKYIGDDDTADLLIRGVPAAMGLDVSGRIGMGNAFSILPFSDINFSKEGYKEGVFGLTGAAVGGLGGQVFDGIDKISRGEYYKGVEAMLPKGLKDGMAGIRMATEGVTTGRGDVVLSPDEITFFDGLLKAVGLPTTAITKSQTSRNDLYELGKHFTDRDSELKTKYVKAYRTNNAADLNAIRAEWVEEQAAKKRWAAEMRTRGFRDPKLLEKLKSQPLSGLLKAPRDQVKREQPWRSVAAD